MTDTHSCSYYCDRPACIKAQRDELRDALAQKAEPVALDNACMTEQAIDEYLSYYTMDGDSEFHIPTEPELALIKDAIMGLLVDPNFLAAFAPLTEPELRAGIALQLREIERLRVQVKQADERGDGAMRRAHEAEGENAVLAGILSDCDNVLATIVADDLDEAEKIGDLRRAIAYALDPYKREGTLL